MSSITEAPVGEPVLLKGALGKYCYNPSSIATSPSVNLLLTANDKIISNGTQYCMSHEEQGVGFYKVTEGNIIPTGTVYLVITDNEERLFYGLDPNGATAISSPNTSSDGGELYNLAGQKFSLLPSKGERKGGANSQLKKGIYIVNGSKKTIR